MVAVPPPSQSRPPLDPLPNIHHPVKALFLVFPPEPPDPPDASVILNILQIFFTSSISSTQATKILNVMLSFLRVTTKHGGGGEAAFVFIGDITFSY